QSAGCRWFSQGGPLPRRPLVALSPRYTATSLRGAAKRSPALLAPARPVGRLDRLIDTEGVHARIPPVGVPTGPVAVWLPNPANHRRGWGGPAGSASARRRPRSFLSGGSPRRKGRSLLLGHLPIPLRRHPEVFATLRPERPHALGQVVRPTQDDYGDGAALQR